MIVNAKQYAQSSGWPVSLIRRLCREGKIPCLVNGRVYLFEDGEAEKVLKSMAEARTLDLAPRTRTVRRQIAGSKFDFEAALKSI